MLIFKAIESIRTSHEMRNNAYLPVVRKNRKEKIIKL